MLCQNCKKNKAYIHYKSNINGALVEKYLCHECAEKEGLSAKQPFSPIDMIDGFFSKENEDIFGGLFAGMMNDNQKKQVGQGAVCSGCGMRFSDFLHGGKIGCAKCYDTFSASLSSSIKRLHGATAHCGKVPVGNMEKQSNKKKIEALKEKLSQAIEKQEYEMAAKYRDEIRDLENKDEEGK